MTFPLRTPSAFPAALSAAWSLSLVMQGCTLGPDFERPRAPAVERYPASAVSTETVASDAPVEPAQRFDASRDVPAQWWSLFQSEALDGLVRRALEDSPRLAQARARLLRAQEDLGAREGATKLPKVDAGAGTNRVDVDGDAFKTPLFAENFPLTLSTASVSVSYTLDLFGRNRRELEALRAAADYERFELEAARLMLAGNVVAAAIEEASVREEIRAAEDAVALAAKQLEIVERLEQIGAAPRLDVTAQGADLAGRRAALPPLRQRLERTRHRLAILLGQPPAAVELPEFRLADLRLPTDLPLSLPSALAQQRPDIRAAEALLHQATARVGVATAKMYPNITLSGQGGAVAISPILDGIAGFALLGASLAQPLFHGGELKAQKRAAIAAMDQAGAAYREVVLKGLQDVADTLVALDADARTLRERAEAARLTRAAYDITARQYEAGGVSLRTLLEAQRRLVAAAVEETRAAGARLVDSAALFQALGGGWWTAAARQTTSTQP